MICFSEALQFPYELEGEGGDGSSLTSFSVSIINVPSGTERS